ncbi:hypothetical protein, partial [Nocardioides sp.]|uniref:hypothetical protein n=1 Tax=Nocardioides sp. TaxID=35761 RepID=UPI002B26AB58
MSESRTFPFNLMGTVIFEVGDRVIDQAAELAQRSPIVLQSRKTMTRNVQTAFQLGRDMGPIGSAPTTFAPVRHLH